MEYYRPPMYPLYTPFSCWKRCFFMLKTLLFDAKNGAIQWSKCFDCMAAMHVCMVWYVD